MSDQYKYLGHDHLRELAARDPLSVQLYVRALRSERIRAMVSTLLRFVWRHIKQGLGAGRIAKRFKRSEKEPTERRPLESGAKALIANLTAMR